MPGLRRRIGRLEKQAAAIEGQDLGLVDAALARAMELGLIGQDDETGVAWAKHDVEGLMSDYPAASWTCLASAFNEFCAVRAICERIPTHAVAELGVEPDELLGAVLTAWPSYGRVGDRIGLGCHVASDGARFQGINAWTFRLAKMLKKRADAMRADDNGPETYNPAWLPAVCLTAL